MAAAAPRDPAPPGSPAAPGSAPGLPPPESPTLHPWDSIHLYAEALAGHFSLGTRIDLRMLSASVSTVEYNPSTSCARMRLVDPGCMINVYASGVCFLLGIASVRDMLKASGMVVAIVKALGYRVDGVSPVRMMCSVFSGTLPFGVRLDSLADGEPDCIYDPEIYSMLMYRPFLHQKAEVCMTIAANGSFIIAGARTVRVARQILERIYPRLEQNSIPLAEAGQGGGEDEEPDVLRAGAARRGGPYYLDPRAILSASDLADLSEGSDITESSGRAGSGGGRERGSDGGSDRGSDEGSGLGASPGRLRARGESSDSAGSSEGSDGSEGSAGSRRDPTYLPRRGGKPRPSGGAGRGRERWLDLQGPRRKR